MPKIVIREFDKTKAGVGNYTNFTVVVPGFIGAKGKETLKPANKDNSPYESVFDEYGIYECSDAGLFKEYIGVASPENNVIREKKAPTVEPITSFTYTIPAHEDESGEMVEAEEVTLSLDLSENTWKTNLTTVATKCQEEDPDAALFYCTLNTSGEVGYLKDANYNYMLVSSATDPNKINPLGFAIIKSTEAGNNEETAAHYGNQIAYELLKLGYTVLYKRLSSTEGETISDLAEESFWEPLKDKAIYDFRYVVSGLTNANSGVNAALKDLVHATNKADEASSTGRGDCIALLDIPESTYSNVTSQKDAIKNIKEAAAAMPASQYVAIFAPWVKYSNIDVTKEYNNKILPASFHYLACAAKASENYNEWYATAGYTRGVSDLNVESTGCRLGEAAIHALEPRYEEDGLDKAVNLVVKIKNSYYLWGNRTAYKLGVKDSEAGDLVASHFLNIRQLCTTIKKQVYVACRRFTFDPNSDLLWINFCNAIRPTLEKMKADQGISDYKFIKVEDSRKALLSAIIRIVPIEAVEDFDISIYLEDSLSGDLPGIGIEE